MKKTFALALSAVIAFSLTACSPSVASPATPSSADVDAADAIVLKAAHSVAPTHPYHLGLEEYARLVKERTGGKIAIDIFHSAQLGNERDTIEGLQMNTLDICVSSTGPVGGFEPKFLVVDLPFLFRDREHAYKVLDGEIGQDLLDSLSSIGVVGAAFWENGFREITNSKRPINSVEDLKGLKLRTQENEVHMDAFRALGVDPTPMAWSEVFTALQQNVIDGQENPVPIIYTNKVYEVQKHLAMTDHFYSPSMLLISKTTFDKFDADTQKILIDSAKEAAVFERNLIKEMDEELLALLKEAGMEITYPDKAPFQEACKSVYEKYESKFTKELIDSIINTK